MIDAAVWFVSWVAILGGSVFIVAGGVGMVRFPDLYTRLHAASMTDTGGAILLSFGLFLQAVFVFGNALAAIKVALILFFTLFTAPTASHALAKTALLCGQVPLGVDGKPILDSPEEATQLARSRSVDYRSGQDAVEILEETRRHKRARSQEQGDNGDHG